jgi:hypothetical protein
VSISALKVLVQAFLEIEKSLFRAIFLAYLQISLYLCALKGLRYAKTLVLTAFRRKRTNKNQRISCPPNEKALPLQSKEK